jgi:hypothetical protein
MSRAQLTSTDQQNSGGPVAPFVAGKNKIINGDFNINQRNFTSVTSDGAFGFDRWFAYLNGGSGATYSTQTFSPGNAITGYESTNYAQLVTTGQSGATPYTILLERIEDVRAFAGQTATFSFWAKAASGTPKVAIEFQQVFNGSQSSISIPFGSVTISTSWARYSITGTIPSISGKTLSAGNCLELNIWVSAGSNYNSRASSIGVQNNTFSIWGVQLEAGSVATPFTTATGTLQGELAAAMRYYQAIIPTGNYQDIIAGSSNDQTTWCRYPYKFPVPMRVVPTLGTTGTATDYMNLVANGAANASSVPSLTNGRTDGCCIYLYSASITTGQGTSFRNSTSTSTNWLTFSAEL